MSSPAVLPAGRRRGRPGYDLASVLAVAVELFNEKGYEGTSMRDLAARLGIAKSAIYHHVTGKEELLSLALDRALDGLAVVTGRARALPAPAVERLEYLVRGSVEVLEADRFRGGCGYPLYEIHPELAFCALAGAPLADSKHTAAGRERRRELLGQAGIALPLIPRALISRARLPRAPVTDTLDAAAVACSAWRIATGRAVVIPARPQRDDRGLPIAIRY